LNEFIEKIEREANNDMHVTECVRIKKCIKEYYHDQFKYMLEITSNTDLKKIDVQDIRTMIVQNKRAHQKIVDDILINF
jgi:hypothetical protein